MRMKVLHWRSLTVERNVEGTSLFSGSWPSQASPSALSAVARHSRRTTEATSFALSATLTSRPEGSCQAASGGGAW